MQHLNLALGTSYFRSPGEATSAAVAALHEGANTYGATEGSEALRDAIAKRYRQEGAAVEAKQFMVTPGSKSALFSLFSVLLEAGDEVVVPTPSWFGFHELLKYSKGKPVTFPTQLSENYSLNPEDLKKVLTKNSRLLLLTNPGNPTGRIYRKEELEAILEVAAEFPRLYIISDEIYDHITYVSSFTSILSCEGPQERVIVVNGFSKSFAMTGWRIGYIVGPPEVIQKSIDFQACTLSGVSPFVQAGALAAMEERKDILKPMQETLGKNRSLAQAALTAVPGVNFFLPEGAYYFFPDFSHYLGSQTTTGEKISASTDLCHYLDKHYSLALSPGDYFGAPGHARMSFAVEPAKLQEALARLKEALETLRIR